MKIYAIVFIFVVCGSSLTAQTAALPKVDERIELLSVVFRLAGADEYNNENYKDYSDAIRQHFDPYKDHKIVGFAKELHKLGVGNSYVADFAVHLESPPSFKLSTNLSKATVKQFGGQENADKFLVLLNDFYRAAKFEEFWKSNAGRYRLAESRFEKLSNDFRSEWYDDFYGQKFNGRFRIVIGLGNGNNFYGPSVTFPSGSRDIYAIFSPAIDDGQPTLPSNAVSFAVHEFNHSFINPLIDKYSGKLKRPAKAVFEKVKIDMANQSYGTWQIMMYESLVRANTIRYLLKYKRSDVAGNRSDDVFNKKFVWVDALSNLLEEYELNRKTYPKFENFIPKIVAFFDAVARKDLKTYEVEFDERLAHVERLEPFGNDSTDVDPNLAEIRIVFDKPLDGKGVSINVSGRTDEKFPKIVDGRNGIAFVDGNKAFTIKVKLEPQTKYGFVFTGDSFQTTDGYPLKTYRITFQTK